MFDFIKCGPKFFMFQMLIPSVTFKTKNVQKFDVNLVENPLTVI